MVPSKIDDRARYDRVGRVPTLVSDRLLLYIPGGSFVFHPNLPARVQDTMMAMDILKSQGFNIQSMHSGSSIHFIHPFFSDYPIQGHGLLESIPAMIGRETDRVYPAQVTSLSQGQHRETDNQYGNPVGFQIDASQ